MTAAAGTSDPQPERPLDRRRARRRALLRARRVAVLGRGRARRAARRRARGRVGGDRPRRRVAARRAAAERDARRAGCSASTSRSPCCTARSARTGPCRGCWRRSTSPTWARAWRPRRVCLDKVLFKQLMSALGRPAGRLRGRARRALPRARASRCSPRSRALGLPVFVKPAHLGSSVGIVKVERRGGARGRARAGVRARRPGDRRGDGRGDRGRVRRARRARTASATRASTALASRAGRDRVRGRVVRLRREVLARAAWS